MPTQTPHAMTILDYLDPLQSGLPITLLWLTTSLGICYLIFSKK